MTTDDGPEGRVGRRRLLAASAGLLGALAGCSGSDDADGSPSDTTTPATDTPTDSPTRSPTASPTPTVTPTASPTPTPDTSFPEPWNAAPSSEFGPLSGFATTDWLVDLDPAVVRVTNLRREGEGSLRWALNRRGPTLVVFETSGVIDLQGDRLRVASPNTFVAGQTAPSPGVTVIRGGLFAESYNVVVQHLRVRPGDRLVEGPREGPAEGRTTDAMSVGSGTPNVIFDHCTATWGSDETMSTGGGIRNTNVTFTNDIIAEGLEGENQTGAEDVSVANGYSKGTLVNDGASKVTMAGNLWAHTNGRHPRLKGNTTSVVVNNFTHNHGALCNMGTTGEVNAATTFIGNVYRSGPDSPGISEPIVGGVGEGYFAFNVSQPPGRPQTGSSIRVLEERPLWPGGLLSMGPDGVPGHVLRTAGARPADRTPQDERLIETVREGAGGIISSQEEVGGYPELAATSRELDPPAAGADLAAWLRAHTRAVELPDAEPP